MENTENKFKHDGLWYIAVEEESCRGCDRCDFGSSQPACTAPDPKLSAVPPCGACERQDNRNVIFVESDVDNLGDEE